jgi:hypothetical protein
MRYRLRTLLIAVAVMAIVGFVGSIALFHLTPPDFTAKPVAAANGSWTLHVQPNFVVNSIRSIKVNVGKANVVTQQGVFKGIAIVDLPATVPAGATVNVECDLQYDRIMPSIESVQHQLILQ